VSAATPGREEMVSPQSQHCSGKKLAWEDL